MSSYYQVDRVQLGKDLRQILAEIAQKAKSLGRDEPRGVGGSVGGGGGVAGAVAGAVVIEKSMEKSVVRSVMVEKSVVRPVTGEKSGVKAVASMQAKPLSATGTTSVSPPGVVSGMWYRAWGPGSEEDRKSR